MPHTRNFGYSPVIRQAERVIDHLRDADDGLKDVLSKLQERD